MMANEMTASRAIGIIKNDPSIKAILERAQAITKALDALDVENEGGDRYIQGLIDGRNEFKTRHRWYLVSEGTPRRDLPVLVLAERAKRDYYVATYDDEEDTWTTTEGTTLGTKVIKWRFIEEDDL